MPGPDWAGDAAPDAAENQTDNMVADVPFHDWDYAAGPASVSIAGATTVLPSDATEFVHVKVSATDAATGTAQDVTGLSVALAFTHGSVPGDDDWQTADWLSRTVDGTTWARRLISAGDLAPGAYAVWVRITDNPEIPVINAGSLRVIG